jgi:hypothetical protein
VLVDIALAARTADADGAFADRGKHGIAGRLGEDPHHAGVFLFELGDHSSGVGFVVPG